MSNASGCLSLGANEWITVFGQVIFGVCIAYLLPASTELFLILVLAAFGLFAFSLLVMWFRGDLFEDIAATLLFLIICALCLLIGTLPFVLAYLTASICLSVY